MGSGNIKYGLMALTVIGALGGCDLPPEWSSEVCERLQRQAIGIMWAQADTDLIAGNMVKLAEPDAGYILSFRFKDRYGIAQTYVPQRPTKEFHSKETTHLNKNAERIYTSDYARDYATFDLALGEKLANDPAVIWGRQCIEHGYFPLLGYRYQ